MEYKHFSAEKRGVIRSLSLALFVKIELYFRLRNELHNWTPLEASVDALTIRNNPI